MIITSYREGLGMLLHRLLLSNRPKGLDNKGLEEPMQYDAMDRLGRVLTSPAGMRRLLNFVDLTGRYILDIYPEEGYRHILYDPHQNQYVYQKEIDPYIKLPEFAEQHILRSNGGFFLLEGPQSTALRDIFPDGERDCSIPGVKIVPINLNTLWGQKAFREVLQVCSEYPNPTKSLTETLERTATYDRLDILPGKPGDETPPPVCPGASSGCTEP